MRRITVDEVLEAYRKTGLVPERGAYYKEGCACGLGVILFAAGADMNVGDDSLNAEVEKLLGIDDSYRVGFVRGFDGKLPLPNRENQAVFDIGYTDGQACAAAVFGEGDGGE